MSHVFHTPLHNTEINSEMPHLLITLFTPSNIQNNEIALSGVLLCDISIITNAYLPLLTINMNSPSNS